MFRENRAVVSNFSNLLLTESRLSSNFVNIRMVRAFDTNNLCIVQVLCNQVSLTKVCFDIVLICELNNLYC